METAPRSDTSRSGNSCAGTASRETERFFLDVQKQFPKVTAQKVIVSEAGASVYSASELAAQEFPDLDVSLRGAVSIARRLQDLGGGVNGSPGFADDHLLGGDLRELLLHVEEETLGFTRGGTVADGHQLNVVLLTQRGDGDGRFG